MKLCIEVDWQAQRFCVHEPPSGRIRWTIRDVDPNSRNRFEGELMNVTLSSTQQVSAAISVVDAKGNPAVIDGVPEWTPSDLAGIEVTPAADGMSALVVAVGPLGSYQVAVSADADLGEGMTPIGGVLDVEVVAGSAVAIGFSLGVPEEQPPV